MTDGKMFMVRTALTFDLQNPPPGSPPHRIQLGPSDLFNPNRFDIVVSNAVTITASKTSSRVVIVVVGREIN